MGDSYRPSRPDRDRDRDHRAPPLSERMTFTHGGDSYRPSGGNQSSNSNRSEFTFQSQHSAPHFPPAGPANSGSGGRRQPRRGGPPPRGPRADNHNASRNGRNNANGSRRGGFRKEAAHERALLRHRDGGSEQTLGVAEGSNRFMNLDDMSDDDEADMDVESDSSSDGAIKKALRTVVNGRTDGDLEPKWAEGAPALPSAPKWSNPDPYTALPPPSETTGVKKDVVQLIRKAKHQIAEQAVAKNAVTANADFISFGDDDDEEEDEDGEEDTDEDEERSGRRTPTHDMDDLYARRAPKGVNRFTREDDSNNSNNHRVSLKNKKRRNEPEIDIVPEWEPRERGNATPWIDPRGYAHLVKQPERWLHNEILDFQEFVAPQPYEHEARRDLVNRVNDAFRGRMWFPQDSGRILCFGSYPAGLYLPTADMDLVYASDHHFNGGPPALEVVKRQQNPFAKLLFQASKRLEICRIPAGRPVVIAHAKVPIIKFQDRITGIDVDISFENLSGVQAQATFDQWKQDYPDLVYMVALVKQFLLMRGLNEVHTGGLGGFSIICLIVSYIHHSPKFADLGECFIGFLEYYGKKFDISTQRIQMHPPAVVPKGQYGVDNRPERPDGLSIQDPNRPDNNISGGSRKAQDVFYAFKLAHDTLTDRMRLAKSGSNIGNSILGYILGGNYDSYIMQRRHLQSLK